MKNKRLLKTIIAVALSAMLMIFMTSCQAPAETDTSVSDSITDTETVQDAKSTENAGTDPVTGRVTSIDGNKITIELGDIEESGMGTPPDINENGNGMQAPPERPDGNRQEKGSDTGKPDEKPDSSESSSDNSGKPSGKPSEKPSGKSDSKSNSDSSESKKDSRKSDTNGNTSEKTSGSDNTPPEMPADQNGTPPEMPADQNGTPPEMPGSNRSFKSSNKTVTLDLSNASFTGIESVSELTEGDFITVEYSEDGTVKTLTVINMDSTNSSQGEAPEGGPGNGGQSSAPADRSAAVKIDSNTVSSNDSYTSDGDDENALLIDGAEATLTGIKVDKQSGSSSNAENGDFYGMNASLLAVDGAQVTIDDSTITSSAQCGNGVFSYGEGTVVNVSDTTIITQDDNSGGIMTTGGGTMNAENLTVTTSGNSAAAIRSDRGGETVNVTGGTYTSKGYNSPAIYSTAEITVTGATLTAENSEALVIEGQNSIDLTDCTVSGNMSDTKGSSSDENVHCIFIYQSMSGDAENGTAEFSMNGGTVINNNGDVFYVTNTACTIDLSDVEIVNNETDGYLMLVSGNSASHGWGSAGSNGAQAVVTATDQQLEGDIAVDAISSLDLTLSGSSVLTGTVNIIDNAEGGTSDSSEVNVTVDNGSTWILTGNCTVTTLTNNGTIDFNGYTITLADGTVLS